jgi:hypothetical protein
MFSALFRVSVAALVFLATSFSAGLSVAAPDLDELCVQAFLDFKGRDVGPLDGAAGSKTFAAAAKYKSDRGVTINDLGPDNASEWCTYAKTDPKFAALLSYDYNTEVLWNEGLGARGDYDQVLAADSVGQYDKSKRSITNPGALSFVPLNGGLVAARVQVRQKDEGHPEDWGYNDEQPGLQQRFELVEKRKFWMKAEETYWVRFSAFAAPPFSVAQGDQLVLSDLKAETNGSIILDPIVEFKLHTDGLVLANHVGEDMALECVVVSNKNGGDNTLCKNRFEHDTILSPTDAVGRWVNIVYRVHWANDQSGTLHVWVNDQFIAGYQGITSFGGTSVQSKFGVYRGYYGSVPSPQPDARVYFAGVGRSDSCEGLGLSTCAAFEADSTTFGKQKVLKTNVVEFDDLTAAIANGAKIRCTTSSCKW